METEKSKNIRTIVVSIILTAVLTSGIFYFLQRSESDSDNKINQSQQEEKTKIEAQNKTLMTQNEKLMLANKELDKKLTSQTSTTSTITQDQQKQDLQNLQNLIQSKVEDNKTGLRVYDYTIFNVVVQEVVPRVCHHQKTISETGNSSSPICIMQDIYDKGGDPVNLLQQYLKTL